MNPFLDPTRAEPHPQPFRLRGVRRRAGRLAMAAGLGLGMIAQAQAVDVNSASQAQLESLRGIGPKTAAGIVQARTRGGPFLSFDDLSERVRGLGAKRLQGLRAAGLTLGGQAREAPPVMVNMPPKGKGKGG
ncbi:Helix-hairpin-helix motif protein [Pigmentiphaga humi]|uniref:Helix-hairpin-helix motif protein n=1 Tax=Pigmentiphaga humi TaxID=2478468 RepID=A0A3P4AZ13_9BURK|nr:helix-hairpin-helix domain-containing protein [Pigmentiphaga humi]VCU69002.1 Helix-hairpin-helix motif protein [Pigmentiphaga humi]